MRKEGINVTTDKEKILLTFNDSPKINDNLKTCNTKQTLRNYRINLRDFLSGKT
jgi:hypothetical protein